MTRPHPRKSTLAGQSPARPETPPIPATPASPESLATNEKQKITITIDARVANQARGVYLAELAHGGPTTWSKWIEEAIRHKLNDMHQPQINALPPGTIPTGRPVDLDER